MANGKVAFSGGLESTVVAQMILEDGFDVELYYGDVTGVGPDPLEASLVYRNYEQLKKLYPERKVSLFYVNKNYFASAEHNEMICKVNQAFRVACLCTDLTSQTGAFYVACGWTGDGAIETNRNPGGYTKEDYIEMLNLPRSLNHLSRASAFPHTIQAPLWGKSKAEIYEKLNPEMVDYIVINQRNGVVRDNKKEEFAEFGIKFPSYVDESGRVDASVINDFGCYFWSENKWERHFNDFKFSWSVIDILTPVFTHRSGYFLATDIKRRVEKFKVTARNILALNQEIQQKKEDERKAENKRLDELTTARDLKHFNRVNSGEIQLKEGN